jgi:acetyl-CoA acetyltransferase
MIDAVVVSTARTALGRAFRGAFNNMHSAKLGGHAGRRAGIDPAEVDDVIFCCAVPEGDGGKNIARHSSLIASVPPDSRRCHDCPRLRFMLAGSHSLRSESSSASRS